MFPHDSQCPFAQLFRLTFRLVDDAEKQLPVCLKFLFVRRRSVCLRMIGPVALLEQFLGQFDQVFPEVPTLALLDTCLREAHQPA